MRDGGSVVITSSVAATRGDPGVYGYITAKHAQVGLMRCLAKELAPRRIRVNSIHPGPIANELQRAQSVLYLASEQSSYTTGLMLMVDGGMSV